MFAIEMGFTPKFLGRLLIVIHITDPERRRNVALRRAKDRERFEQAAWAKAGEYLEPDGSHQTRKQRSWV